MWRRRSLCWFYLLCAFWACDAIFLSLAAAAQDTRTVTEPVFPPVCTTLTAQLQEIDNTLPAGDESSFDTVRVQDALNACPAGEAVELTPNGTNGDNAFLIQPITIPGGVTLLLDAGVTVYGSRNPGDYDVQTGSCGIVATSSAGCEPLIAINADNAGIMGYGAIDGRGGQTLTAGTNAGVTWWQLAYQAQKLGEKQYNPQLLKISGNNITLYKITLANSPNFHVTFVGDGLTAWDVKVIAPGDARNTDGIDPGPAQNVTIADSYIGDGDDNIALKPSESPGGGAASEMSILNDHFYVGHGMSIGSQTAGGASNILAQNLDFDGDSTNKNDTGIRIKSESSNGGIVSDVTYEQICMQNVAYPIQFNPFYSSSTGSNYPQFENITLSDVTVLTPGMVMLEGYSTTYPLGLTLDNVNFSSLSSSEVTAENANVTLGPGPVSFASYISGTDVNVSNNVTNPTEQPYACSSASFPLLAPELFGSAGQVGTNQPLTLTAIFEPVREPNWESSTAGQYSSTTAYYPVEPTGNVTFYDGSTQVGQAALDGSGDMATVTLSSISAGAHNYTAVYSGDSNYVSMTSPAFAVTAGSLNATTTKLSAAPATVNAGQAVEFTATVSSGAGTPQGTVTLLNGSATLGTGTLDANGVATFTTSSLAAGSYNVSASYAGNGSYAGSVSSPVAVDVQGMTLGAGTSSLNIAPGGSANTTLTVTGAGGSTGTVSYSCSGLPAYMTCSFSPASTSLSGNTTSTVLTISVAATMTGFLLPVIPLLGFLSLSRKRRRWAWVAVAVMGVGIAWLTACGGGGGTSTSTAQPPPAGPQTVTVTATMTTAAGTLTSTKQVTVNVQ